MSQEKFEQRLNEVLDERRSPSSDEQLTALAAGSQQASQQLAAAEALLEGLDARQIPSAPEDLAELVVTQLETPPRWSTAQVVISVVIAASLLVAVFPALLPKGEPAAPGVLPPVAGDQADPLSGDMQIVLDESQKEYLAMMRITGEAMAMFPSRIREAAGPLESGPVGEGFRPVGASFSAALNALRQTLPHKPSDSES